MKLSDLNINAPELIAAARKTMTFGAIDLAVRTFLPISAKSDFITFVINNALDQQTGTCSPVRLEIYFTLAAAKWYADIDIEWSTPEEVTAIYDAFVLSGFAEQLEEVVGDDYQMMIDLTNDTVEDLTRYSMSLAGMLSTIGQNTSEIDGQLSEIMAKVKDKEGLEVLDEIRNVVGKD